MNASDRESSGILVTLYIDSGEGDAATVLSQCFHPPSTVLYWKVRRGRVVTASIVR